MESSLGPTAIRLPGVDIPADVERRVAIGLLVDDSHRFLLAHRHPARTWFPNVWDMIGGHIEAGEDARDTLVREVREEIGVEVTSATAVMAFRAVDAYSTEDPGAEYSAAVFRIDAWDGEPTNCAPHEHDALQWFTLKDLHGNRHEDLHGDLHELTLAEEFYPRLIAECLQSP